LKLKFDPAPYTRGGGRARKAGSATQAPEKACRASQAVVEQADQARLLDGLAA
jgi:hypothetical protein